jgi:hypothetical protein
MHPAKAKEPWSGDRLQIPEFHEISESCKTRIRQLLRSPYDSGRKSCWNARDLKQALNIHVLGRLRVQIFVLTQSLRSIITTGALATDISEIQLYILHACSHRPGARPPPVNFQAGMQQPAGIACCLQPAEAEADSPSIGRRAGSPSSVQRRRATA